MKKIANSNRNRRPSKPQLSNSKQRPATKWTLAKIKTGLEKFFDQHQRYPTAREVDTDPELPSARQIQRYYGGLRSLREQLGWSDQIDFTRGHYSRQRAHGIQRRSNRVKSQLYRYLVECFDSRSVQIDQMFSDDGRSRPDFFILNGQGSFLVDILYPKDKPSLIGCLNAKQRKYRAKAMIKYPVIFVQMNQEITNDELTNIISNKQNKLNRDQHLMSWDQFKAFCDQRAKMNHDGGAVSHNK